MTPVLFERCAGDAGYWFTFWQGELRTFRDEDAARAFAKRQWLRATFVAVDDFHDGSEI